MSIKHSGVCRICRCNDRFACEGGCTWADAEHTLCSSCISLEQFDRDDVVAIACVMRAVEASSSPEAVVSLVDILLARGFAIGKCSP